MAEICVIGPGGADGQGGISRHVRYVSRHWQQRRGAWPMRVFDSYGRSAREMPFAFLRCTIALGAALLRRRVRVVHLHMASAGSTLRKLILLHLVKLTGVPVVLHLHGSTFAVFYAALSRPARWLLSRSMRRADTVIALGGYWRTFLVDQVGLDPARVRVMPNAVASGPLQRAEPTVGPCRLLFLGRIGPRKGTADLLHALAGLRADEPPGWSLTCAGDGDVEEHAALAARLGLGERVTFTGWVDEDAVADLLMQADALVLPSHHENLPMAILEAMAHALPVIATPVGAIPDVVIHGRTGLLVPVGDIGALAAALHQIIDRPDERKAMGAAGRSNVTAAYDLDAYCDRLDHFYHEFNT